MCCCAICVFYLFCAVVLPLLTLFYASIQKISTAFPAASNFTTEHFYKAFTMNAATTALGNSLWLALWTATLGVAADGADLLDHLSLAAAGRERDRIHRDVPAVGAAADLRIRHDVGVADLPDPDLRHAVAAADRLPDGVPAARRAHDLGRDAADRQEPGGMRADVRRRLGLSHPHRDGAAALARPARRVAAAVRRQHPRARRLDPADGAALQGDHAVDRGELVRQLDRAHRRDGADPDRWWWRSR